MATRPVEMSELSIDITLIETSNQWSVFSPARLTEHTDACKLYVNPKLHCL